MDATLNTKVRIDLKARIVELEGSEEFVSSQIEWIKDLIQISQVPIEFESTEGNDELPAGVIGTATVSTATSNNTNANKYKAHFGIEKESVDTVIHTEENEFRIITTGIKGNNAEMQVNYSLLYCLANEYFGHLESSFEELRDLCKSAACLDESNFATIFSRGENKKYFLVNGKPHSKSKVVKLTTPGRAKAKELLASLVG